MKVRYGLTCIQIDLLRTSPTLLDVLRIPVERFSRWRHGFLDLGFESKRKRRSEVLAGLDVELVVGTFHYLEGTSRVDGILTTNSGARSNLLRR